jgi:medium-chain acyl-[acyl-carrier-protein] hydrolase
MSAAANQLLRVRRPVAGVAGTRLVCFPYAGSACTVFHAWPDAFAHDVEVCAVQLPARQDRLRHAPFVRVPAIVREVASAMTELVPKTTVLFGHSFGALLSFELSRALQAAGSPPAALVVGARRAPDLPVAAPPIYSLPESEFLEAIHRFYGTPRAALYNRDLMAVALPSLRADFEAMETHVHVAGEPLDVPITVLRGTQDVTVSAADAAGWSKVTRATTRVHDVDAGHFFIDTHRSWVLDHVRSVLASAGGRADATSCA